MLKMKLSAVLFACITTLSVAAVAAEPAKVVKPVSEATQSASSAATGSVNINTADAGTIEATLSGIGKVKAQAIVDHRTANGPFASVDELLEVKGIGAATLEKNRGKLSIN